MMDMNTAANIAEIGGGIAILVSLIYVGYQIRQSNRIASAAALQSVLDGFAERIMSPMIADGDFADIMNRGIASWESLSMIEQTQFTIAQGRDILHVQNVMQLHDKGLLDSVDFEAWIAYGAASLITPGGKEAWKYNREQITPTVVTLLEKYVDEHPSMRSMIDMNSYRFPAD
jgi:hypothetical protein